MISRRALMEAAMATAALTCGVTGFGRAGRAVAADGITEDDLLAFDAKGQVTLLHLTDIHAQLVPMHFREPSVNIGVGPVEGKAPHITGEAFLERFGIKAGSGLAHALTPMDFSALAKEYGKMGGLDRIATIVKSVRAERGDDKVLFLDGGDTWQGSYTSLKTDAADMVACMAALEPDAMTGHWEFTYGEDRVLEIAEEIETPFLAGNIFDTEWEEPVFDATRMFEKGGVQVAVIGQAFPYTPIANPRWMIPNWSFGIRPETVQKNVDEARDAGAEIVVLLSHDGFDVDRKLASVVSGIDVILTGHTHDAVPEAIRINDTLLISSGSHGKFLSRLDLDVKNGKVADYAFRLIPVFSDVIAPDPDMAALVEKVRAPYSEELARVIGQADSTLYRRGNFNGAWDDVLLKGMMRERDAEIALSPGFRWGPSLPRGHDITIEDLYGQTGMTYPSVYRQEMTGETLKVILEDVCDNLFNPDPFYQQGGDMVRVGGMGFTCAPKAAMGGRINDMTLLSTGEKIEADRSYVVAGWASINEEVEGPAIYDLMEGYIADVQTIVAEPHDNVKVVGVDGPGMAD